MIAGYIISIFVLLGMSGFFSGSETALTAASRGKLRSQADKGSHGAQRALACTSLKRMVTSGPRQ